MRPKEHEHLIFDAMDFETDRVVDNLSKHGVVQLKQLIETRRHTALLELMKVVWSGVEKHIQPVPTSVNLDMIKSFVDTQQIGHIVGGLLAGSPLTKVLEAYFKAPFTYVFGGALIIRRAKADIKTSLLPYHQDASVFRELNKNFLTVWLALCDCGTEAPGLEYITTNEIEVLPFHGDNYQVDPQAFEKIQVELDPELYWTPVYQAGDVTIALDKTLHRSYATPEMQGTRYSVESADFLSHLLFIGPRLWPIIMGTDE